MKPVSFNEALGIVEAGFETWREKPHNAKWFKLIDGTPIPNDLMVNIAEAICRSTLITGQDWQPMTTAPKDGTDIIVHRPKFDGNYIPKVGVDWWSKRLQCWGKSRDDTPPMAWQPLPSPPALTSQSRPNSGPGEIV